MLFVAKMNLVLAWSSMICGMIEYWFDQPSKAAFFAAGAAFWIVQAREDNKGEKNG